MKHRRVLGQCLDNRHVEGHALRGQHAAKLVKVELSEMLDRRRGQAGNGHAESGLP